MLAQLQNFVLNQVGINRVEARKRLVQDNQLGVVQHRGNELHLLLHAFAQFLHRLIYPVLEVETGYPLLDTRRGIGPTQTAQLGQVKQLLTHFHLLVEAALLGQIANLSDVRGVQPLAPKPNFAFIGPRNLGNDADERGFSGPVRTQQAENTALGNGEAHAAQGHVRGVSLVHVNDFKNGFHRKED